MEELLEYLISIVSHGGNMLLNVGPSSDGMISPLQQERLRQLGEWLKVNGEGVYDSRPWHRAQKDPVTNNVWYTSKDKSVYAFFLDWPQDDLLSLGGILTSKKGSVTMLGHDKRPLDWTYRHGGGMVVQLPSISVANLPCLWAWTLKLEHVH